MRAVSVAVSVALLAGILTGCGRNTSVPEEVSDSALPEDERQPVDPGSGVAGVPLNTLWRFEAQFLDGNDAILATTRVEVLHVAGQWRSDLAPLQVGSGYRWFRDPGLFGSGESDMAAALHQAPLPITLQSWQGITPVDETTPMRRPAGAVTLRARVLEICPIAVRRMRQYHWRPRGESVVDLRQVQEEMRWREYRVSGPCHAYPPG